ncbi:hypothetical protein CEXT_342211 [Caerostris extrusa]|uniref:Uncharacterized protein n=1 Tax=Caerostris extrusa TaxID=172846 RepID=A0AAV4Q260_CAEEX|nr:hypothetical protein CEXT_342211 [Caerostris extrusa]
MVLPAFASKFVSPCKPVSQGTSAKSNSKRLKVAIVVHIRQRITIKYVKCARMKCAKINGYFQCRALMGADGHFRRRCMEDGSFSARWSTCRWLETFHNHIRQGTGLKVTEPPKTMAMNSATGGAQPPECCDTESAQISL